MTRNQIKKCFLNTIENNRFIKIGNNNDGLKVGSIELLLNETKKILPDLEVLEEQISNNKKLIKFLKKLKRVANLIGIKIENTYTHKNVYVKIEDYCLYIGIGYIYKKLYIENIKQEVEVIDKHLGIDELIELLQYVNDVATEVLEIEMKSYPKNVEDKAIEFCNKYSEGDE